MALWFYLFVAQAYSMLIKDGETLIRTLDALEEQQYEFPVESLNTTSDMLVYLTSYKDARPPALYVSLNKVPSSLIYDYKSSEFGESYIKYPYKSLVLGTLNILVQCESFCSFAITLAYESKIEMIPDLPLSMSVSSGRPVIFEYTVGSSCYGDISIELHPKTEGPKLEVFSSDLNATLPITSLWDDGSISGSELSLGNIYTVTVTGQGDFLIFLTCQGSVQIPMSRTISGKALPRIYKKYRARIHDNSVKVVFNALSGVSQLFLRVNQEPTDSVYDYTIFQESVLEINTKTAEWIYFGVLSEENSDFTIAVTSGLVDLRPGIPQKDRVLALDINLYSIQIASFNDYNITINISAGALFAKLSNKKSCSFSDQEIVDPDGHGVFATDSSDSIGLIHIEHFMGNCKNGCQYCIGVFSEIETDYVLTAYFRQFFESFLMVGEPMRWQISEAYPAYYKFSMANPENIRFIVHVEQGNAGLFVSKSASCPSSSNADKVSMFGGYTSQEVQFNKDQGLFHVAVRAYTNTVFSIVAQVDDEKSMQLYPGHAIQRTINRGEEHSYQLSLKLSPTKAKRIKFHITKFLGAVEFNVNNSTWVFEETFEISPEDQSYEPEGVYNITVTPKSNTNGIINSYLFSVHTIDSAISIIEGIPFEDTGNPNQYKKYTWLSPSIRDDRLNVVISLTDLARKSELCVNIRSPKHSDKQCQFRSYYYANSTVEITYEELKLYCKNSEFCKVYISVRTFDRPSKYSLLLTSSKNPPSLLKHGEIVNGGLSMSKYAHYYVILNQYAEVRCADITGKTSLLADQAYIDPGLNPYDWVLPTLDFSDSISNTQILDNLIILTDKKLIFSENVLLIGVYCESPECQFSLSVKTSNATALKINHRAQARIQPETFIYYAIDSVDNVENLLLQTTRYGGGYPEIYVQRDSIPTTQVYDWKKTKYNQENFYLNITSGVYYVGITSSKPLLAGFVASDGPIRLIESYPQHDLIPQNSTSEFYYYNYKETDIRYDLSAVRGRCILYIDPAPVDSNMESAFPSKDSYTWSSIDDGDAYSVHLSVSDPDFCSHCFYKLTMSAVDLPCEYSLSVTHVDSIFMYTAPYRGKTAPLEWEYFMFNLEEESSFLINVDHYSGDPEIYVAKVFPPNETNSIWTSLFPYRSHHIEIEKTDGDFYVGPYYIGLRSEKSSRYSLNINAKNSVTTLIDGLTNTYMMDSDLMRFDFYVDPYESNKLFCQIETFVDDLRPEIYILFEAEGEEMDFPTRETASQWYSDYDNLLNILNFPLDYTGSGRFLFSLVETQSMHTDRKLSFSCTTYASIQNLKPNTILSQTAEVKSAIYQIDLSSVSLLEVHIIPCEGELELKISKDLSFEDIEPGIQITDYGYEILGVVTNAIDTIYVSVTVLSSSATYQIFPEVDEGGFSPFPLKPGENGKIKYKNGWFYWKEAEYETNIPANIQYFFYYTRDLDTNLSTACSIRNSFIDTFELGSEHKVKLTVKEKTLVNVIAVDMSQKKSIFSFAVYNPTLVDYSPPEEGTSIGWLILFIVLLILVLIAAGLYFYLKYKRNRSVEGYEMVESRIAS